MDHAMATDGVISFDCETTGLDALVVKPTLYSIASGEGPTLRSAVIKPGPMGHRFLKEMFLNRGLRVVMHNSSYDLKIAHRFIIRYRKIRCQIADTMVYAWLDDNRGAPKYGKRFSLKSLVRKYIGYEMNTLKSIFKEGPLAQERIELEKKARKLKKNWHVLIKRHMGVMTCKPAPRLLNDVSIRLVVQQERAIFADDGNEVGSSL